MWSPHPLSRRPVLDGAAAILGDVALVTALIFAGALVPGLALKGITTAAALILGTFGRQ